MSFQILIRILSTLLFTSQALKSSARNDTFDLCIQRNFFFLNQIFESFKISLNKRLIYSQILLLTRIFNFHQFCFKIFILLIIFLQNISNMIALIFYLFRRLFDSFFPLLNRHLYLINRIFLFNYFLLQFFCFVFHYNFIMLILILVSFVNSQ